VSVVLSELICKCVTWNWFDLEGPYSKKLPDRKS
jgi:hypothetical protein